MNQEIVNKIARFIVINRDNFIDRHPSIKSDANSVLLLLEEALKDENVIELPPERLEILYD